jgi:hypothetical protein
MDGSGLLALDQQWQARVDGILDRPLSLAKNRLASPSRDDTTMSEWAE